MKKILAISGGVDSMVMLDILKDDPDVIIAHFNHGTRPSADADELFVKSTARGLKKPFFSEKAELGENVSEETARLARYSFLKKLARRERGIVYTAHHQDDVIESIIINLLRGTGWRGLAPLSDPELARPLLNMSKKDILRHAAKKNLSFRQDPTNAEGNYLRNRIRSSIKDADLDFAKLLELSSSQRDLKLEIDRTLAEILPKNAVYERSWFTNLPDLVAVELLRAILTRANLSATRPQLTNFLSAIRSYPSGKFFNLPGDRLVRLDKSTFSLTPPTLIYP